ncbi:MAG: hypothetical protein QOH76_1457 [Thermoleophilaceae bacterium]|jgi:hypothetical protein|nr:hypothetical protein [Thermoleophilaceae bacterium]
MFNQMKRVIAGIVASGLLVGAASATAVKEALPFTTLSPANGARIPRLGDFGHITFRFTSPDTHPQDVWIEVSTRKTRGQDDTLANRYQVDVIDLFASYAHPHKYSGPSDGDWTNSPGKYYWQIYSHGTDPNTSETHDYVGPVRSLRIVKRCHYVKRHGHRVKVCT